ncbi:MAG: MBL fold metallo-hydrolase [Deltaproteobacteria bacterium]|nr:MBL fold metallo-hydrolase [Deltaproteobacteria bacterium]
MSPVVEVLDGLFFIERGYLSGNHFAFRSPAPVLIDTAYSSGRGETFARLEALGVDWRRTRLIVNTHCHCDHVGANRQIQQASGCEVAMHGFGRRIIAARDSWSTWWDYYHQEAEFYDCTRELEDAEPLAIGPHEFEVIHTPGHSRDGIVLYHRKEKLLLSADTLWESDLAVLTTRVEGSGAAGAWAESLERLSRLDVRLVYPGHGRPFPGFREALRRSRERVLRYR